MKTSQPYRTNPLRCITMWVIVFAAVALVAGPAHGALVGYWPFDGNANDASGTGNNGALNGNAGFSGVVPPAIGAGQSLSLDGDGDYVSIPASASLNSSTFSLSYWVNQNGNVQNGGFERVTSRGGDTFETAVANDSTLRYYRNPWVLTGKTAASNDWTHVSWVNTSTGMSLYVNGEPAFIDGAVNAPSGVMHIGARHNGAEGFAGFIDDVALHDVALNPLQVQHLAAGVSADQLSSTKTTTVVSNTSDWQLSTVSLDGGPAGTWVAGAIPLPGAGTFVLAPSTPATNGGINSAAAALGMGAQPIAADNNIHFYRTTFDLNDFDAIAADLQIAIDNGVAVFINGTEIARENSFLVENWAAPFPSLLVGADGTIATNKFETSLATFNGFVPGTNEVILAVRNPNSESNPAGGFAFKLQVFTESAVPEPATASLGLIGLAALALRRRRRC